MFFDRFDIVEAHYLYCRDWHGGQWSKLYLRLCRIQRYFRPNDLCYDTLSDNGREVYDRLVAEKRHQ